MSTEHASHHAISPADAVSAPAIRSPAKLHSGDRMTREEFHRIYEQTPEDFKAELIGGTVYVASPLSRTHGRTHGSLIHLLSHYEMKTPGVEQSDNTTVQLGGESEPQPDAYLLIQPPYGGQTKVENDYVVGAPELVVEVAHSTRALDLNAKKDDYARHGVLEYLVVCPHEKELRWFDLRQNQELRPDDAGVYRIHNFPGLWINGPALIALDQPAAIKTLDAGLATAEHTAFVRELERRRKLG